MSCLAHSLQLIKTGMFDELMANRRGRCLVTSADTGGGDKSDALAGIGLQLFEQALTATHHAGQ